MNNNKIMTLEFKKLDFIFFMWRRKISLWCIQSDFVPYWTKCYKFFCPNFITLLHTKQKSYELLAFEISLKFFMILMRDK